MSYMDWKKTSFSKVTLMFIIGVFSSMHLMNKSLAKVARQGDLGENVLQK